MKLIPEGWRWPRIILHIFDHESTTVTLGLWLFIVASLAAFVVATDRRLTPDQWLWCVIISGILVGGVRVGKDLLSAAALKFNGGKPADFKEDKTDAPAPVPPAQP